MNTGFAGKLGLIQRVLPAYRAPFFGALAQACGGGVYLAFGKPHPIESIQTTETVDGVNLFKTRNMHFLGGSFYFCFQKGLHPWLEKTQLDALIIEANPRYLSSASAIRWMHAHHKPVIGWGLGAPGNKGPFNGLRDRFLKQFDTLIAYSQKGADEYASMGFDSQAIFVAKNAVTAKPAHPMPTRPLDFPGKPVVLFVGRLQARKRLDNLIQACAQQPADLQPELWVIGDGPARQELEALAHQFYSSTQFLGAKFGEELIDYFKKADLFVLPGTGGLAIQQAMSFGLPVIVAGGDGTQNDLVRPGNGWQIPSDDLEALTKALTIALSDPARLRDMGAEGYRIVSDEINLEKMVDVFMQAVHYSLEKMMSQRNLSK
jgi:glycosyltransferase involved in cell wall biosynthesis